MFTGLIEATGELVSFVKKGKAAQISIKTDMNLSDIKIGESIAINGVCLSVTSYDSKVISFDVSPETMSGTTFDGKLHVGAKLNLERAMKLGDRFGGHIVSGHVDCMGVVKTININSGNKVIHFLVPKDNLRYIIVKGSITVNGVSLTVNEVTHDTFSVNIIPITQTDSNISTLKIGDSVNIETDMIGKYIEKLSKPYEQDKLREKLIKNGFM